MHGAGQTGTSGTRTTIAAHVLERTNMRAALSERDFGQVFRIMRQYQGATQTQIAAATGMTQARISRLMGDPGIRITHIDVIERIADGLAIPGRMVGLADRVWEALHDVHLKAAPRPVTHSEDGAAMVLVPEGVFLCGPHRTVSWLSSFYIDATPVTNDRYARFVGTTGHQPPRHWPSDGPSPVLADHPVVNVTWTDARAYATWAGKSLPSDTQWEKAARGTRGLDYPWGNQPTPAKCNVRESDVGSTTPAGMYRSGVSPYGALDMCGNVWEWCDTATSPRRRVLKGSAFTSPFASALVAEGNDAAEAMFDDDTGFRTVAEPDALRP